MSKSPSNSTSNSASISTSNSVSDATSNASSDTKRDPGSVASDRVSNVSMSGRVSNVSIDRVSNVSIATSVVYTSDLDWSLHSDTLPSSMMREFKRRNDEKLEEEKIQDENSAEEARQRVYAVDGSVEKEGQAEASESQRLSRKEGKESQKVFENADEDTSPRTKKRATTKRTRTLPGWRRVGNKSGVDDEETDGESDGKTDGETDAESDAEEGVNTVTEKNEYVHPEDELLLEGHMQEKGEKSRKSVVLTKVGQKMHTASNYGRSPTDERSPTNKNKIIRPTKSSVRQKMPNNLGEVSAEIKEFLEDPTGLIGSSCYDDASLADPTGLIGSNSKNYYRLYLRNRR
jgi:trimeric autotransporter adhesin